MLLAFVSTAAAASFCGNWVQLTAGKCSLSNKCCQSAGTPIPSCTTPICPLSTSVISQEGYQFAGDGKYAITLMIGTGQSCPLTYDAGPTLFVVDTQGSYISLGDNIDLGNGWQKVQYHPQRFITTVSKSNQANFFTPGVPFGPGGVDLIGPCMKMAPYLNDPNVGCPCNDTWTVASIAAGATNSSSTRTINVSSCPLVNSTNGSMVSSCPESFFFDTRFKYGNLRITNQTNSTNGSYRLLEITQPNFNSSVGWNSSIVYANFTADFSCPSTIGDTKAPTAQSSAVGVVLNAAPYLFAVCVLALLR